MLNFDKGIKIIPEYLNLISEVDFFKGKWEAFKTLAPERLGALRKVASIESVGSSTRIEGAKLSDREVDALFARLDKESFKTRDEQEVAGYAEVLEVIFENFEHIVISENYIKQLHSMLLKHSVKDERHRGSYKTLSNSVEAFDVNGKSVGVVFETVTPFDTPREMERLINWLQDSIDAKELHPLLTISIFIVSFLAIHPFQDGNGRLSRILTSLLLLKSGYLYVPYGSLERIIEDSKDSYYLRLRQTQKSLKGQEPEWEPWVLFFLRVLKKQKDNLQHKVQIERLLMDSLPELSVKILEIIKGRGRATNSDIEKVTGANRSTIKARLKELVADNILVMHGKGRGVWYSLK